MSETKRAVICLPIYGNLFPATVQSLKDSTPLIKEAGWEVEARFSYGNPYISNARDELIREALDRKADVIVFIDQDVSWAPRDLLTLIETPGDVVAGTYRFKTPDEDYMGQPQSGIVTLADGSTVGTPQVKEVGKCHDPMDPDFDDAIIGFCAPAGFLKITPLCVDRFMRAYPHLVYGWLYNPIVDLFNHGAHNGVWYGEDYAFCRNWRECGGELLILPNLNISHWKREEDGSFTEYPGNYHWYLASRPGGARDPQQENSHVELEAGRGSLRRSAA